MGPFFPLLWTQPLGFSFCFVIDRTFPLFLSTSQASWMWLQTRAPLPLCGCWIPGPLNLFAKNFQFSRQWSSFVWGPPPGSPILFFPWPDPQAFSGCLGSLFGLNKFFPSFYAFPPPGLLPFPFKGIVRFRGAMLLLVPLTLNNIWILILAFPGGSLSTGIAITRSAR